MPNVSSKKKGCLKLIFILLIFFGVFKGCSAYQNRPSALYKRWLGTPVPEDVTNLKGAYKFQLTESICFLSFNAPPERITQIVAENEMTLVVPDIPWDQIDSTSQIKVTVGDFSGDGYWFQREKPYPLGQQIYWASSNEDEKNLSGGWALYYEPSSQKVFFTLHTI